MYGTYGALPAGTEAGVHALSGVVGPGGRGADAGQDAARGEAMQVLDPGLTAVDPTLRLVSTLEKLKYDELLSDFAFKQLQPAPLHSGGCSDAGGSERRALRRDPRQGRAVQVDLALTPS